MIKKLILFSMAFFVLSMSSAFAAYIEYDEILHMIYPTGESNEDWIIQQDGEFNDNFISFWNTAKLGTQPTEAEVLAQRPAWLALKAIEDQEISDREAELTTNEVNTWTLAEADAWIDANVGAINNLAQAKAHLLIFEKKVARYLVAIRRRL